MTEPVVSVIIPAYNCEEYIEAAVRSVLAQTYQMWELIVIDDASTDSTGEIVRRLTEEDARIRLLQNPENMGVSRTRNRGLEICIGDYVAFLDGDDVWHPEKLQKQLHIMMRENAALSYTSYAIVDREGKPSRKSYRVPDKTTFSDMLRENVIGCSTVMLSGDAAEKYRFTTDFYHEDYCLWLDILRDGYTAAGCPEVLVDWRLITDSRSFNKKKSAMNRWRIYREYLGFSFAKSAGVFLGYMISGIRKYCL